MAARVSDPADFLPLKPSVFSILLVLLEGERHGYAIMKAAQERGDWGNQLQPGALYRLLKQLLDAGLVEELDRRKMSQSGDERRRYYAITAFGRQVAASEAKRMAHLVGLCREHDLIGEGDTP